MEAVLGEDYCGTCMEVSLRCDGSLIKGRPGRLAPAFLVVTTGGARLRLVGELDVAGVPLLRALLSDMHGDIEIDCSGLTFIDCSGLRVLEETQRASEAAGVRLCLVGPSRCLTRLMDLFGLDDFFDVRHGSRS